MGLFDLAPIALFLALVVGHCLGDYPLQGDFLAKAKNRHAAIAGVPWYHAMFAHAAIQSGLVWLLTGSWALALMEFVCHFCIDCWKCDAGAETYHADVQSRLFDVDQLMHVLCKAAWVWLLCAGLVTDGWSARGAVARVEWRSTPAHSIKMHPQPERAMGIKLDGLASEDVDAIVARAATSSGEDPVFVRQILNVTVALETAATQQISIVQDRYRRLKDGITPT